MLELSIAVIIKMVLRMKVVQPELVIRYFKNGHSKRKNAEMVKTCKVQKSIERFIHENCVLKKDREASNEIFSDTDE